MFKTSSDLSAHLHRCFKVRRLPVIVKAHWDSPQRPAVFSLSLSSEFLFALFAWSQEVAEPVGGVVQVTLLHLSLLSIFIAAG